MDASNRRKFPITNIGSVTLMMILIVLCMVTFAALALSTAISDHQAAEKSTAHVHDYYEASNQAEEQLASIDEVLQTAWQDAPDQASYYDIIRAHYANATGVSLSETDSGMTLSWKNDLSDSQALQVSLDVLYPANATGDAADTSQDTSEISQPVLYQITAWQVIATREWNGDNSLNLMNK